MTATEEFYSRLTNLIDNDGVLPCWDRAAGNPWIGSTSEEREYAAHHCQACPLIDACADMATEQEAVFGIYGGLDYAQQPGKRRTPPKNPTTQEK